VHIIERISGEELITGSGAVPGALRALIFAVRILKRVEGPGGIALLHAGGEQEEIEGRFRLDDL